MPNPPIQGSNVGIAGAFLVVILIITAWLASNKRLRPIAGLLLLTLFLGTLVFQWPYLQALFRKNSGGASASPAKITPN